MFSHVLRISSFLGVVPMKRIAAVILAAGVSRRLGYNKLTVRIDGESVLRRSTKPFLRRDISEVLVVTGHNREVVEQEMGGLSVRLIYNPDYREGMSTSVRAVLPFLGGAEGVFFHLGDKPLLQAGTVSAIIERFLREAPRIIVPIFRGERGHPVLFDGVLLRGATNMLRGDVGLRELIEKYERDVVFIEGDEGTVFDIDTVSQIDCLRERGYTVEESKY